MSNILCVLGMHRSGTSLTAQWLNKTGLNLGDMLLIDQHHSNEDGHYEDDDFLRLHGDALVKAGFQRSGLGGAEEINDLAPYFKERLKAIVNFKSNLYNQWGWKEPRTCLFLNFYKGVIPEAKFLVVFRNPELVVASLIKRDFKDMKLSAAKGSKMSYLNFLFRKRRLFEKHRKKMENKYLNSWILYNSNIIEFLDHLPKENFIVFDINDFSSNNPLVYGWLKNKGFKLNLVSPKEIFKKKLISQKSEFSFNFNHDLKIKAEEILKKLEYRKLKIEA